MLHACVTLPLFAFLDHRPSLLAVVGLCWAVIRIFLGLQLQAEARQLEQPKG